MNITEQLIEIDILVCRLRHYSTMSEYAYADSAKLAAISEMITLLYEIQEEFSEIRIAAEEKQLEMRTEEQKERNNIPF